jgi:hypothetical protein
MMKNMYVPVFLNTTSILAFCPGSKDITSFLPLISFGMKHPFHIHGTQFKVLSVDGEKPPKDMRGKKDVID